MRYRTNCTRLGIALTAAAMLATPAFAQGGNCLQDEYSKVQSQSLNCTANDVSVAQVVGIRDPVTGLPMTTCIQGTHFNFLADFQIKTTSSSSRSNIGLYFATASTTQALTGSCMDNIISPSHACPSNAALTCGSDNYHELDGGTDKCGDTSSSDSSPVFGTASEGVTIEVDNFLCMAPANSTTLVMPNCTSWQVPGKTNLCVSAAPGFPYPAPPAAIPGSPSKCNCSILSLPITPVTVTPIVQKACTTAKTTGPISFAQSPSVTESPTQCDAGPEGSDVTYTVAITNTSTVGGNNIVIDQICDSLYGKIYDDGNASFSACPNGTSGIAAINGTCPPSPIAPGATGTCTFTATIGENVTTALSDTVKSSGHSVLSSTSTFTESSNSVSVTSSDAPSTATVTKGLAGTEAACATVRYNVDVHNSSGADEVLTLSSLTDTSFGNITQCTNASCAVSGANTIGAIAPQVLGTTCGVDTGIGQAGLGTLNGVTGAGSLQSGQTQTIPVGGDYKCQFDGLFCGGVDQNTCISNTDSVSAGLKGDETEAVTETENTLKVTECFATPQVTSTP